MRMGGHVPGPGVEDPHHAELPAEGVGIESQGVSGSRRGLKKQGVQASLVRAGERAQCLRSRTGNQNGRDRQEQRTLLCSPRGGRGLLARGAMPVRAGMRAVCQCSAGGAWGEMPAKSLGPALGTWPPWPLRDSVVYGRGIERGRPGHGAGSGQPTRPWEPSRDAQRVSMRPAKASRARMSALAVRGGERAVVVGALGPT